MQGVGEFYFGVMLCFVGFSLLMAAAAIDIDTQWKGYPADVSHGRKQFNGRTRKLFATGIVGDSNLRGNRKSDYAGKHRRDGIQPDNPQRPVEISSTSTRDPRRIGYRSSTGMVLPVISGIDDTGEALRSVWTGEMTALPYPEDLDPCVCLECLNEVDGTDDDDYDDDDELVDGESFDGGFGRGSYFSHAMAKDD
jgi:hypothetical protein